MNGHLEDYAHLAEGLLALYETTFEAKYFVAARELAEKRSILQLTTNALRRVCTRGHRRSSLSWASE